jgi:gliding motility-associated-like protein
MEETMISGLKTLLLGGLIGVLMVSENAYSQGEPVYYLNGSSTVIGEDCYQITPATNTQTGSVWYADQVDLSQPLDLQFLLNLGNNDSNGADGICFVLQSVGTEALGQSGGGIGFLGEDFQPAFAIEFDTYQNADFGDPIGDHIAMVSNGSVNHLLGTAIAGPVQADAFNPNIEDGEDHQGRVTWDPVDQVVRVYFDCELRLEGFIDLVGDIFNGQNQVYFGFTAGTGGANNLQTVCLEENILGSAEQSFVCPGAELQLNVPSPSGAATWSPGDYLSDSLSASPVATPPEGLTEPLIYVAQYQDNCGADIVDTIQLNVEVMTAEVDGVTNLTCDEPVLNLSATSNFPGPLEYNWSATEGNITFSGGQATVDEAGSFDVLLSFGDGLCEAAASFVVAYDTATYTGEFPEAAYLTCDAPTVELSPLSLSSAEAVVTWATVFGEILGAGPTVTALEPGTYVAAVNNPNNGCSGSTEVEVFDASEDPVIAAGTVEPLTCVNPGQPVVGASVADYAPFGGPGLTPVVSWTQTNTGTTMGVSPPNGSLGPIINAAGDYQLVVEWAETGCADSVIVNVVEGEDFGVDISSITFPNILTADNNGKNDSWYPFLKDLPDVEALSVLTNYALRVYNRWGQVVFTNAGDGFASGTSIRWYGNGGNGDPLTSGTYWYIVDYTSTCGDSQSGTAQGQIEIIRR